MNSEELHEQHEALSRRIAAHAYARDHARRSRISEALEAGLGGIADQHDADDEAVTREELERVNEALRRARRITLLVGAGAALTAVLLTLMVPVLWRDPGARLIAGIVLVVVIGGIGLVLRGLGELRGSSRFKATGYFLGAGAYVATATVALTNGLPLLVG